MSTNLHKVKREANQALRVKRRVVNGAEGRPGTARKTELMVTLQKAEVNRAAQSTESAIVTLMAVVIQSTLVAARTAVEVSHQKKVALEELPTKRMSPDLAVEVTTRCRVVATTIVVVV